MKRIAIYYRVSTDKQDIESQKHAVGQFLKGLPTFPELVLSFEDIAVSGKQEFNKRKGAKALLAALVSQKIDTVVVYKLDRISRVATKFLRVILAFDELGIGFFSVADPAINIEGPFRPMMLAAMGAVAQIERESIVGRVNAGLDAARARGVVLGPPRKVTPHAEARARVLRDQGMTIKNIASEMGLSMGTIHKLLRAKPYPHFKKRVSST